MATAQALLNENNSNLACLPIDSTVLEAAKLMNQRHIGSVLVVKDDHLAGIFTERDVLRRIVAEGRDPATTPLAEVMTTPVACASPKTTQDELRQTMREKRIRHIPVVDGDRVLGMVSIGDVNRADANVQQQTIQYLEQYISVF